MQLWQVPPWASAFGGNEPAPCPCPPGYISKGSFEPVDVFQTNNFPGEGMSSSWGHHVCVTGDDSGKVKFWTEFTAKSAFFKIWGSLQNYLLVNTFFIEIIAGQTLPLASIWI
jgi:hypothetical protein